MTRLSFVFLLLFANLANAEKVVEMSEAVCAKVKACGIEQIAEQQIPEEMQAAVVTLFEGMCATMVAPYIDRSIEAGLEDQAVACLEAVEAQSCDELVDSGADEIPVCQEYKEAAEAAGVAS